MYLDNLISRRPLPFPDENLASLPIGALFTWPAGSTETVSNTLSVVGNSRSPVSLSCRGKTPLPRWTGNGRVWA